MCPPPPENAKNAVVTVEIGPTAFYILEGLLLLGDGPGLPAERTLPALLAQLADLWAEGVLNPSSPTAALMRELGHLTDGPPFKTLREPAFLDDEGPGEPPAHVSLPRTRA